EEERATSVPHDPASIQRQIEDTRAELAVTIDAIAEIVSPKRVAERANVQVKAKVAELRHKLMPDDEAGPPELGSGSAHGPVSAVAAGQQAAGQQVGLGSRVRWGRLAVATGTLLLLAVGASRRRRRRHS
nr:DUF3618 domain-containing protein [Micromonospora sp. DSM 115978]